MDWTFDIECFPNYFLALFKTVDGKHRYYWQLHNGMIWQSGGRFPDLRQDRFFSFNGNRYDMPMLSMAWSMLLPENAVLKELSNLLIGGMMPWQFEKQTGYKLLKMDHVDLIEVCPGIATLKIYGARNGSSNLKDLPLPHDHLVQPHEIASIIEYCEIDNNETAGLVRKNTKAIELRERLSAEYGVDVRSKSDAQIAEGVIAHEYERITGEALQKPNLSDFIGRRFKYSPPRFVFFQTPEMKALLQEIREADFLIKEDGSVEMPECLHKRTIEWDGVRYMMGVGGLHSIDAPGEFRSSDTMNLVDIDVASYYPSIILNAGFYPKHIGPVFLDIYRSLVDRRLTAKHEGKKDDADSLKITINGTFGKLGSKWSKIYSPDLLFHVTVTGQLCLLMLIEQFGKMVISANTDGITLYYEEIGNRAWVDELIGWWERVTGFVMERTPYRRLNRRDISNYIAITEEGKVKGKGLFADPSLMKNPVNQVCINAVKDFLQHEIPIENTIYACDNVYDFLTVRTVKGGAVKDGVEYGKSIRWYYSRATDTPIFYATNGNTVPRSECAMPLMEIPDSIPDDLDRQWYIREAEDILDSIGA